MIPLLVTKRGRSSYQDSFSLETFNALNIDYGHWFFQGEALAVPYGQTFLTQPQFQSFGSIVWQKRVIPQQHWVAEFSVAFMAYSSAGPQAGVAFFLAEDWIGPLPKPEWPTETLLHPSCYQGKLLGVSVDANYKWRILLDLGGGPQLLYTITYNPPYDYFTVRLIYAAISKTLRVVVNGVFIGSVGVDLSLLPSQMQIGLQGAGGTAKRVVYNDPGVNAAPGYNIPRFQYTPLREITADVQTRNLMREVNRVRKKAASPEPIPGLWSPVGLPLRAWFDPSDPNGVVMSSNRVTMLTDLSGNGRHITQSGYGPGPTLEQSPFRFRDALRFQGGQVLDLPATVADGSTSLFIVFRSDLPPGTTYSYAVGQVRLAYDSAVNSEGLIGGPYPLSASNWGVSFTATATDPGNVNPHAWNWLYNRQVGVLAQDGSIYSDGHYIHARGPQAATGAFLGMGTGSLFYSGWVGEILLVDGSITADVRQKIEGYLAWKWGIRDRLPSSHPYRLTLPPSSPVP